MSSSSGVTRRGFLTVAVSAIVAGVVAGVGAYYAGTLAAPVKEVIKEVTKTVTTTTTLAPGAPITVTVTAPPTTVTKTVTTTVTVTPTPTRKSIRFGIDVPGTGAAMVGSQLVDLMRSVFPTYDISPYSIGGVIANTKEFLKGNLEVCWSSGTSLKLLHAREEPFKDVPRDVLLPVHTLYTHSSVQPIVTTKELKKKYRLNSWKDLAGKKAAIMSVKYENHMWYMRAFQALGINVQHVEMDLEMFADALKKEDIVACLYSVVGGSATPWAMTISTKTEPVIIHPSPAEVEVVEKAGLPFVWYSTKKFRESGVDDQGLDKTFLCVLPLGFNSHPKFLSEDEVYRLLKEMIARKDELAKMTKFFAEFAEDPIGLQATAVSAAPDVPVHPGLAKLLKEYGAWRGEWKVAS